MEKEKISKTKKGTLLAIATLTSLTGCGLDGCSSGKEPEPKPTVAPEVSPTPSASPKPTASPAPTSTPAPTAIPSTNKNDKKTGATGNKVIKKVYYNVENNTENTSTPATNNTNNNKNDKPSKPAETAEQKYQRILKELLAKLTTSLENVKKAEATLETAQTNLETAQKKYDELTSTVTSDIAEVESAKKTLAEKIAIKEIAETAYNSVKADYDKKMEEVVNEHDLAVLAAEDQRKEDKQLAQDAYDQAEKDAAQIRDNAIAVATEKYNQEVEGYANTLSTKKQENTDEYNEKLNESQKVYNDAVAAAEVIYNDSVKAAQEAYDEKLATAQTKYDSLVDGAKTDPRYLAAQEKLDNALAEQTAAQTVKFNAETILTSANEAHTQAEQELTQAQNTVKEKETALENATNEYNQKVEAYEAAKKVADEKGLANTEAQDALKKAQADVETAKTALNDKSNELDTAKTNTANIANDLAEANKQLEDAKKLLAQAQAVYDKGALGFYETMAQTDESAKRALEILNYSANNKFEKGNISAIPTELGKEGDATNLENVKETMLYLQKANEKRAELGLTEYGVSNKMMAISQVKANLSSYTGTHENDWLYNWNNNYQGSENLSGTVFATNEVVGGNPVDAQFEGWVDGEKDIYDKCKETYDAKLLELDTKYKEDLTNLDKQLEDGSIDQDNYNAQKSALDKGLVKSKQNAELAFNNDVSEKHAGHYRNFISNGDATVNQVETPFESVITGVGFAKNDPSNTSNIIENSSVVVQNFQSSTMSLLEGEKTYTVDQYVKLFTDYYNSVMQGINDANTKIKEIEKRIEFLSQDDPYEVAKLEKELQNAKDSLASFEGVATQAGLTAQGTQAEYDTAYANQLSKENDKNTAEGAKNDAADELTDAKNDAAAKETTVNEKQEAVDKATEDLNKATEDLNKKDQVVADEKKNVQDTLNEIDTEIKNAFNELENIKNSTEVKDATDAAQDVLDKATQEAKDTQDKSNTQAFNDKETADKDAQDKYNESEAGSKKVLDETTKAANDTYDESIKDAKGVQDKANEDADNKYNASVEKAAEDMKAKDEALKESTGLNGAEADLNKKTEEQKAAETELEKKQEQLATDQKAQAEAKKEVETQKENVKKAEDNLADAEKKADTALDNYNNHAREEDKIVTETPEPSPKPTEPAKPTPTPEGAEEKKEEADKSAAIIYDSATDTYSIIA